jgi:hypothetical protein
VPGLSSIWFKVRITWFSKKTPSWFMVSMTEEIEKGMILKAATQFSSLVFRGLCFVSLTMNARPIRPSAADRDTLLHVFSFSRSTSIFQSWAWVARAPGLFKFQDNLVTWQFQTEF